MSTRSGTLTRLLLVATAPALATGCDGCGRERYETVNVPSPPLRPTHPVPLASSTSAQPGDQALLVCGPEARRYLIGSTGSVSAGSYCYAPVAPVSGCLAATDPALGRVLGMRYAQCVHDGPYAQTAPDSGVPWCCYNLGFLGEGRPLWVAGARRQATLAAGGGWG